MFIVCCLCVGKLGKPSVLRFLFMVVPKLSPQRIMRVREYRVHLCSCTYLCTMMSSRWQNSAEIDRRDRIGRNYLHYYNFMLCLYKYLGIIVFNVSALPKSGLGYGEIVIFSCSVLQKKTDTLYVLFLFVYVSLTASFLKQSRSLKL